MAGISPKTMPGSSLTTDFLKWESPLIFLMPSATMPNAASLEPQKEPGMLRPAPGARSVTALPAC